MGWRAQLLVASGGAVLVGAVTLGGAPGDGGPPLERVQEAGAVERPRSGPGGLRYPRGAVRTYRMTYEGHTERGQARSGALSVEGRLVQRVLGEDGESTWVECRLEGQLLRGAERRPVRERLTMALDRQGSLKGFLVPPSAEAPAARLLQSALASFQLSRSVAGGSAWSAEERDLTGRYLASYRMRITRAGEGRLTKSFDRYRALFSVGGGRPTVRPRFSGQARVDLKRGLPLSVGVHRRTTLFAPGVGPVTVTRRGSLLLIDTASDTTACLAELRTMQSSWRRVVPSRAAPGPATLRTRGQQALRPDSVPRLVRRLGMGAPASRAEARREHQALRSLLALLRADPEAVARAGQLLAGQRLHRRAAVGLLQVLGYVPTRAAHALLLKAVGSDQPEELRGAALLGLGRSPVASVESERALLAVHGSPDEPARLRRQALMSLGTLAGTLLDKGLQQRSHALVRRLCALHDEAASVAEQHGALVAIGNARSSTSRRFIGRLLELPASERTRLRQLEALRSVPGVDADARLHSRLRELASPDSPGRLRAAAQELLARLAGS